MKKKSKSKAPEASESGSRSEMDVDRLIDPTLARPGARDVDIDIEDEFWG